MHWLNTLTIALPSWKQEVSECSRHTHQCLTPLSDEARVLVSTTPPIPSQPKTKPPEPPTCRDVPNAVILPSLRSIFSTIYSVLQGCIIFTIFGCVDEGWSVLKEKKCLRDSANKCTLKKLVSCCQGGGGTGEAAGNGLPFVFGAVLLLASFLLHFKCMFNYQCYW